MADEYAGSVPRLGLDGRQLPGVSRARVIHRPHESPIFLKLNRTKRNKMIKILSNKEKREVEKNLKDNFGIKEVKGIIAKMGKEKLFLFSGSFSEKNINNLGKIAFIERIGIYFAKIIDKDIKLSIEGTQVLKEQINKNIFELKEEQMNEWMKGRDLLIESEKKGFFVIKFKDDFLGCGKISQQRIANFIPKGRRLKEKN